MTSVNIVDSDIAELTRVKTEASTAIQCKFLLTVL